MTAQTDPSAIDEVSRRFAAEGFELAVAVIGTGRQLAVALNANLGGAGPVAMGDTAAEAAALAWSRFAAHRDHYLTPGQTPAGQGSKTLPSSSSVIRSAEKPFTGEYTARQNAENACLPVQL